IFAPSLLDVDAPMRLVWRVDVGIPARSMRVLLDAMDGTVVREYPLAFGALDRQISDANNTHSDGVLVRGESAPPCGIADADNASGAINESLSDVWGELVDLTNGHGNDAPSVRWLIGEELALATLRSMSNPPLYDDPDRYRSPLYLPPVSNPSNANDNGWVHT